MPENVKISITLATLIHFPELCEIWEESVLASHDFLRKEDFLALKREMPAVYLPAMDKIWLARINRIGAGFLGICGNHVEMLFVRPGFFRMGVASGLLRRAKKEAKFLELAVNTQNNKALRFYLDMGFTIDGFSTVDGQGREYPLFHLSENKVPGTPKDKINL